MQNDIYQNMMEYLATGGWVMIPMIVVSVFMLLLIVIKILEMRAFTKSDIPAEKCVAKALDPDFSPALWQQQIMVGFLKQRTFNDDLDASLLESLRLRQAAFVRRHIGTIAVLAAVAPLLGLLGTVGGMIKTFTAIAAFGTGNAKALASGISEALITTQTGLVVAIPGLFLAAFLRRKALKVTARMQRFCLGLLKFHKRLEKQ
ncbi:MotA/TolQ/ExbB proton channel family protein [uncultured Desulfobacter sp.]|uniref:MotA/TolQ/ExbB proton channel family protein n=1 Tax=uncultured Desulfobacter sp. TaxID=240139 RepID=UPI002AABB7CC|nr:MotA/TolQ/ExbB proton channel family protein [uncultured Desulfobacter sp.]